MPRRRACRQAWAILERKRGDYERAAALFEGGLKADPNHVHLWQVRTPLHAEFVDLLMIVIGSVCAGVAEGNGAALCWAEINAIPKSKWGWGDMEWALPLPLPLLFLPFPLSLPLVWR